MEWYWKVHTVDCQQHSGDVSWSYHDRVKKSAIGSSLGRVATHDCSPLESVIHSTGAGQHGALLGIGLEDDNRMI